MNELITNSTLPTVSMTHLSNEQRELLPVAFGEFLDTAATATSRATFYNTRAEQEAAIESVHDALFQTDRGVYATSLLLPGLTDYSRQIGAIRLLRSAQPENNWLSPVQESSILRSLLQALPTQRVLKMFGMLRTARVNNARTRRLILSTVLSGDLEFLRGEVPSKTGNGFGSRLGSSHSQHSASCPGEAGCRSNRQGTADRAA